MFRKIISPSVKVGLMSVILVMVGLLGFLIGQQYYQKHFNLVELGSTSLLKTVRGSGFYFSYPNNWVASGTIDKGWVDLDPPGEGPNPYSEEKGDGTNPLDDILVFIKDGTITDSKQTIKENGESGWFGDASDIIVGGHTGIRYRESGMTENVSYEIDIDGDHILYFNTAGEGGLLELLLNTLRFDR